MKIALWKRETLQESDPPEQTLKDELIPQLSSLSIKYCQSNILPDDNDIWIEGRYRSSTTGEIIPYFRLLHTGKCIKVEPLLSSPPTTVITWVTTGSGTKVRVASAGSD